MKEATEFGIKYLRTLPDGSQKFVMHQNIWTKRKEAEQMVENLRGVVGCPVLVEIWDPIDTQILNDAADGPNNLKAKEPLPDREKPEGIIQDIEPITKNPNWNTHTLTYTSHPDGTVTATEDGKEITDPEEQKQIRDRMHKPFDYLKWYKDLNNRMFLWDPEQGPFYHSFTSPVPKFKSECSNPAFKCECGD